MISSPGQVPESLDAVLGQMRFLAMRCVGCFGLPRRFAAKMCQLGCLIGDLTIVYGRYNYKLSLYKP